jgi:hypothetical protein
MSTLIPPGRQVQLPIDFNETQLRSVVEQLERYGARPVSDIAHLETAKGLVYSTSKKISSDQIDAAREADEKIRQDVADQQVENAGVALLGGSVAADHMQESTLEVRELAATDRETPVKGGVDTKITVSRKGSAGRIERKRG